ncbi:MAG: ATP-binding protein [Candidatus Diapherotrites archaeon]|uniref:ATP-binding protein n=1 Tax=Candidatus Iainarchaeum sp. TaxID=3101447 RepID=A0A8T4LCE7_9ARCH|nr:ATP-binding protein [Candidatus Diapherotrites archaeon]
MWVERQAGPGFRQLDALYKIVAVIGPRQAGKTTFLREQMAKGRDVSYVSLDDPSAKSLFDGDVKRFEQQYLAKDRPTIIDEVQYGKEAGIKLKYLADAGYKLWVSASSQALLEASVLSHLTGRVGILTLPNFSLGEFLSAKGQKAFVADILRRHVWEHAVYGGYPAVVLAESPEAKKTLLKNLFTTALLKDTFMAFGINDQEKLERLAKYLAANIGTEINYGAISKKLGISTPTLQKYMDALEKSYLITRVRPYFTNKGLELAKQPKLYFNDTGMRNAIMDAFPNELENEGKMFENYVLNEIRKAGFTPNYWKSKSKAEVDFVVQKEGRLIPIEVKTFAAGKIERSLRSFIEKYKPKKALVVAYEGEKVKTVLNGCEISVITADEIPAQLD